MVDIGGKDVVERRAVASGEILLSSNTLKAVAEGTAVKGDPLVTAEVAGLQAAKKVWEALPHCHPIPISHAQVNVKLLDDRVRATAEVRATYKTGVEMEALYGAAVALLTVWDMVKYLEKDEGGQYPTTRITNLRVDVKEKTHVD